MNANRRRRDWTGLEELRPYLRAYLGRRCRDESEVDDITQETLMRAARYRTGLTDAERLRSWILRIAANVFRDHLRRESRLPRYGTPDEVLPSIEGREPPPGELAEDPLVSVDGLVMERDAAVQRLGGALRLLRPEDRAVLGSYYGGAQSCGRTAVECDIPAGLVKVRLFRARRRLLRTLGWLLAEERHAHLLARTAERRWKVAPSAISSRVRGRRAIALAILVALLFSGPSSAQAPAGSGSGAGAVETPPAPAEELLLRARALKLALQGTSGDARRRAREAAIDAYRAVRARFPGERAAVAEASFRAGELLRAAGEAGAAREEFALAAENGERTAFRARARVEIGHIERRAGRLQPALAAYEAVVSDAAAAPEHRDGASLWAGRVYADLGRGDDAERIWRRVAETGFDPLDRVQAYDYRALALVARKDLEGGAGMLEACRRALEDVSMEETQLGERVRNAILGMHAVEEIKRIVARSAVEDG